MPYKYELSDFGKKVFKGGNLKTMSKPLKKIFPTKKKAEYYLTTTLGSESFSLYKLKKIKR